MSTDNCLFCKIIKGDIPSSKVYEDEYCYAFRDINPQMPVHILVVPKKHLDNILGYSDSEENILLAGKIQLAIGKIARQEGIDKSGFRVISNCGKDAAQSVLHLHYHILGGSEMAEKMV